MIKGVRAASFEKLQLNAGAFLKNFDYSAYTDADALKAAINDFWRRTGQPEKIVPLEDEHLEQESEQASACCGSNERGCGQSSNSDPA